MDAMFSLGDAILGTADSPVHAPDTFRDDLLHKHLDAASRAAVAQTCKAGLTWVLQEWPEATLRFAVRAAPNHRPDQLPKRLQAVADQLSLRGDKPTTLALVQRGWQVTRDDPGVRATLAALQWPNPPAAFTLALQLQYIPHELLSQGSAAFAGLTSLALGPACGSGCNEAVLPAPSALPALRHRTVQRVARSAQAGLWASVGPYMRQLQSLVILEQPGEAFDYEYDIDTHRPLWASLFSHSTATQTLQRVSLAWPLEPWLGILLQRHVPSLQELAVQSVMGDDEDARVSQQCSWTTLRCTDSIYEEVCSWLPVPESKLVVEMVGKDEQQRCVVLTLDTIDEMAHKLSRLALTGCSTLVLTAEEVLFEDELQVLRDALPHVKTLHTPGMELQLEYFTITPAFAAELAELQAAGWDKLSLGEVQWHTDVPAPPLVSPLPPLHSLNLGDNLEDTLLQDLGRWCPVLRKLDVQLMGLSGPLPEGCVVPWEVVGVGFGTSVRDWLQQSEWLGKDIEWELGTLKLSLTAEEVANGDHHNIAQQLRKARITKLDEVVVSAPPGAPDNASLLRACFAVLPALPCKPKELTFHGWRAAPAVVSEFRALSSLPVLQHATPHPDTLTLQLITGGSSDGTPDMWPLARLPQLVPPHAFNVWRVNASGLHAKELEAFVYNTPADCCGADYVWGQHGLTISVRGKDEQWCESMRARLAALGTSEHIALTVDEW